MRSVGTGTWIVDLDGVIWLAGTPIAGASEAVDRLRTAGVRVLFVTNNSAPTLDELVARLGRAGITAHSADLVTSAEAAAALLAPGDRVLSLADGGATEALLARGVSLVTGAPADAVLVGWTHDFDFERLTLAAQVIRAGARFIGTNEDATHPTPEGLLPGAGALLAAVATAADAVPDVAGKPHPPIVRLIAARTDDVSLVVGDRPATDGALAEALGVPFGLVLSGVTASADDEQPVADYCAPDLLALVTQLLATTETGSPVSPPTRSSTVGVVPDDDGFQRYVDAATALAQLARGRIEEIARDLAATGEAEGGAAKQWTDDLLERSRSVVDEVVDVVRSEVTRQLETLGLGSPDELLRRLSDMFSTTRPADRSAPVRDVVAIDTTPVEPAASARPTKSGATKSGAAKSGGRQRTTKPKGADKKKPAKKSATAAKRTPHTASKAAQKSAKASGKKATAKKSAKTAPAKKSAGRGT